MKQNIIIYDWDNTLLNTNPICQISLNEFFKDNQIQKTVEHHDVLCINNLLFEDYLKSHFSTEEEFKEKYLEYRKIYSKYQGNMELLPHAKNFLSFFKNINATQCIISNKPFEILNKEIQQMNVDQYFDEIFGGDSAAKPKPDTSLFYKMLNELDIKKQNANIFFMGDSSVDVEFSSNANIPIIYFGSKDLVCYKYDKIIYAEDYSQEPNIIFQEALSKFNSI
jgi:phosphoglycolate phosphatase